MLNDLNLKHIILSADANKIIKHSLRGKEKDTSPLSHGAGHAVQSIAQSIAIAVQDSSDTIRNIATVQSTTMGVATQKYIETKDHNYIPVTKQCQANMDNSVDYWKRVGITGADILDAYKKIFTVNEEKPKSAKVPDEDATPAG
nr:hypothetical protein [uncultured Desulfobacter sp.]